MRVGILPFLCASVVSSTAIWFESKGSRTKKNKGKDKKADEEEKGPVSEAKVSCSEACMGEIKSRVDRMTEKVDSLEKMIRDLSPKIERTSKSIDDLLHLTRENRNSESSRTSEISLSDEIDEDSTSPQGGTTPLSSRGSPSGVPPPPPLPAPFGVPPPLAPRHLGLPTILLPGKGGKAEAPVIVKPSPEDLLKQASKLKKFIPVSTPQPTQGVLDSSQHIIQASANAKAVAAPQFALSLQVLTNGKDALKKGNAVKLAEPSRAATPLTWQLKPRPSSSPEFKQIIS